MRERILILEQRKVFRTSVDREEKSETPLHVAVLNEQLEICILLLAKGAQINAIEYHLDAEQMEDIAKRNTTDDPRVKRI